MRDDLVGAANLALLEAIYNLRKPHDAIGDINAYLLKRISRAFRETVERDSPCGPSPVTRRIHKMRGKDFQPPQREEVDLSLLSETDNLRRIEQREEIESLCETDLERQYVQLQVDALPDMLTNVQAAASLGVSEGTVRNLRKALAARYHEQCLAMGA